jgi:hypothetical protein
VVAQGEKMAPYLEQEMKDGNGKGGQGGKGEAEEVAATGDRETMAPPLGAMANVEPRPSARTPELDGKVCWILRHYSKPNPGANKHWRHGVPHPYLGYTGELDSMKKEDMEGGPVGRHAGGEESIDNSPGRGREVAVDDQG